MMIENDSIPQQYKEGKFLPEGYYYLAVGEALQVNDYFWSKPTGKWLKVQYTSDVANWVEEHVIREK